MWWEDEKRGGICGETQEATANTVRRSGDAKVKGVQFAAIYADNDRADPSAMGFWNVLLAIASVAA